MASVRIDTGPIEATLPIRHVPAEKWRELLSKRRSFLALNLPSDCRYLLQFVTEAQSAKMWKQTGHADLDDLIKRGLELNPRDVSWALEGLRSFKPTEAVRYADAITLGKRGRPKKGEEKACTYKVIYGSVEHWRGRLEREAATDPEAAELARRVIAGEITASAAAAQKGWRKARGATIPSDMPLEALAAQLRRRFKDPADRAKLAQLLTSEDDQWPC